jgi:hypothetical protein
LLARLETHPPPSQRLLRVKGVTQLLLSEVSFTRMPASRAACSLSPERITDDEENAHAVLVHVLLSHRAVIRGEKNPCVCGLSKSTSRSARTASKDMPSVNRKRMFGLSGAACAVMPALKKAAARSDLKTVFMG